MQCAENQLLHYYITDHDLQGRVNDPTTNQPTCVDFLGEYDPSITTTTKSNNVVVNSNN